MRLFPTPNTYNPHDTALLYELTADVTIPSSLGPIRIGFIFPLIAIREKAPCGETCNNLLLSPYSFFHKAIHSSFTPQFFSMAEKVIRPFLGITFLPNHTNCYHTHLRIEPLT